MLTLKLCAWRNDRSRANYWSALATALKVPFTVVPMLLTPAIIKDGKETRDQGVFDGRGPRVIFHETQKHFAHC